MNYNSLNLCPTISVRRKALSPDPMPFFLGMSDCRMICGAIYPYIHEFVLHRIGFLCPKFNSEQPIINSMCVHTSACMLERVRVCVCIGAHAGAMKNLIYNYRYDQNKFVQAKCNLRCAAPLYHGFQWRSVCVCMCVA